jgi:PhzF family phenazine biosynthesis protein
MRIVPFKQVDVFTAVPYRGNPVAVVLDAEGLTDADMQRIANWTNLSETTFVLPATAPGADYRVRIFTPRQELPFAGHPSVGTAHAVLEAEWARQHDHMVVMQCAAGVLPIYLEGDGPQRKLFVRAPAARIGEPDLTLTVALAKVLGVPIEQEPAPRPVAVGPTWIVVDLREEAIVRGLAPDMARLAELTSERDAVGVAVYGRTRREDVHMAVRCFAPGDGIAEDPVTGSGNACIAAYLRTNDLIPAGQVHYRVSQGREIGRDGYLDMRIDPKGAIEIGGQAVTCLDGTIRL